jgi:hypothetical protein
VFYHIAVDIFSNSIPQDAQLHKQIIDSMPIITAKGKNRIGKVAKELTDKGFCPSKDLYYYGLKLHMLAFVRTGTMPFPNKIFFSAASENDLTVAKEQNRFDNLIDTHLFADKAYCETDYFETRKQWIQLDLFTPVKAVKGTPEVIKQRELAANNLFSNAVSKSRQPIESLFNWLIEKTNIQNASKVRSTIWIIATLLWKNGISSNKWGVLTRHSHKLFFNINFIWSNQPQRYKIV